MKKTLLVFAVMITLISQSTLVPTVLAEKQDNMPVIDSKNERIQNQWIALFNPESANFSDITGYLKVSISVQGPGDE